VPGLIVAATAAPLAAELAALAEILVPVTVRLRAGRGGEGCGVVWRGDGLIVTNAHVVRRGSVRARLWTGEPLDLRLVALDPERDLAALEAPGRRLAPARPGDPGALRVGELLVALGHPLGVANAVSLGVVHQLVRDEGGALRWIAADLRLAPGNSGGPVAGVDGRVLGISTLIAGGLGYAVPAPAVERFLREAA
jgi:serine protease Do